MRAIEFDLDLTDVRAMCELMARESGRRSRVLPWLRVVFVVLLVAWMHARVGDPMVTLGTAVFGGLLILGVVHFNRWWFVRHNMRLQSGPDGFRAGRVRMELQGGDHILVDAPESSSRLALSSIRRIETTANYHFLFLGPVMALIVRRSAEGADAFIAALRRRMEE